MAKKIQFGTLIHATLRSKDLLPVFIEEAKKRFPDNDDVKEILSVMHALDVVDEETVTDAFYATDYVLCVINETLFDLLNEDLPPYVYFGTTEGDGSDFGYWFSLDSFEEAVHDGEVLKVSDLSEVEFYDAGIRTLPLDDNLTTHSDADYVAVVNDHGNVTLYARDGSEIWSVV